MSYALGRSSPRVIALTALVSHAAAENDYWFNSNIANSRRSPPSPERADASLLSARGFSPDL